MAVRYRDLRLVNLLLLNNADSNVRANDGNTMLHVAMNYYNEDIVNLLLEYDVDMEAQNSCGLNPFHLAIKNKCIDGAKVLLKKGADVNKVSFSNFIGSQHNPNQRFTPLRTSITQKDADMVKFLLQNGARLGCDDNEIFLAVQTGCVKIVELLIKHGANVNVVNNITGHSLLYTGMKIRSKEGIRMLLHHGADPQNINETGEENETALHLAVKAKDDKFVRFLVDIGVDVNICNANDSTALWFAHGQTNIANILIKKIALLKVNNYFVSRRNEIVIETIHEFNLYFSECIEEMLKIQQKKCCNVPLMDFLNKDEFFLARFSRRGEVVADFEATVDADEFPVYFTKLKENMEKGIKRWELIKEAKTILGSSSRFEPLYDVLDKIVDNFSDEELNHFIKVRPI